MFENSTWVVALNYRESDDNALSRIGEEYFYVLFGLFWGLGQHPRNHHHS